MALAEELVARAAVSIDNAPRYTREHNMAVTLQRSLLPWTLPEQSALEIAYRYLPAQPGVGGDWFDVLPLSGTRVALVVGDVVGHGLHAAATMGRLRTAVHNFSALDLPPEEPDVPSGPPLGLGGLPFETAELEPAEGSRLVLYTDRLVEDRTRDIDVGLELLREALSRAGDSPEDTCRAVLDARRPRRAGDDIALIVARTRALPADRIAQWPVPADPAAVGQVRAAVLRKLAEWDLDELGFTTELILSELMTNAIRYGGSPIRVRMLRDRHLICEVFDGSSLTASALRHDDGRGRAGTVPGGAARGALGHPLSAGRQGHLGGAADPGGVSIRQHPARGRKHPTRTHKRPEGHVISEPYGPIERTHVPG
ncbi:hypothetical protein GCM10009601_08470 [Streptomyces thermospinosisporus]|uniref:PPM-type phosphatase domain-containing protein n=1 Tax=Streptomyces thermospinosisporus TaxID=161482 RepID=A0ABN1YKD4_9ACTN